MKIVGGAVRVARAADTPMPHAKVPVVQNLVTRVKIDTSNEIGGASSSVRNVIYDRFRMVVEAAPNAMIMIDQSGRIRLVNKKTEEMFGYARAELLHQPVQMLVPERSKAVHSGHVQQFFARPAARAMGGGRELFGLRKDGTEVPIEIGLNPIDLPSGPMTLASIIDITERKRAQGVHDRLAAIVEHSDDAIIGKSAEGIITDWNRGAEQLFGYTAAEAVGQSIVLIVPDRGLDEAKQLLERIGRAEVIRRFETVRRRKDGSEVEVSVTISPIRNAWGEDGRILGFSAIFRDISEQKRAEVRMRLVMRELSHRTKNLLAVIMAMIRQTATSTTDAAVLQSELIERLQSLSASHDLLVAEDWAGAPLEELIRAVLQPFVGSSSDALECAGPSLLVNAVAAQNLGMALHELATNAAKYGALSTPGGRVRVTWSFEPDGNGERRLALDWSERNGPAVEPPAIKGFGHVVIECVSAQALNASFVYEFPKEGVHWAISIPADFLVRRCSVPAAPWSHPSLHNDENAESCRRPGG